MCESWETLSRECVYYERKRELQKQEIEEKEERRLLTWKSIKEMNDRKGKNNITVKSL